MADRLHGVWALKRLGGDGARDLLLKQLGVEKDAEVRKAVVEALETRFAGDPGVTKALNGAESATPK